MKRKRYKMDGSSSRRRGQRASWLRSSAALAGIQCWDWRDQLHKVETPSVRRRWRAALLEAQTRPGVAS